MQNDYNENSYLVEIQMVMDDDYGLLVIKAIVVMIIWVFGFIFLAGTVSNICDPNSPQDDAALVDDWLANYSED